MGLSVQSLALIWPHFLPCFHQNGQPNLFEDTLAGCLLNGETKEVKQLVQGQEWNLSELHLFSWYNFSRCCAKTTPLK